MIWPTLVKKERLTLKTEDENGLCVTDFPKWLPEFIILPVNDGHSKFDGCDLKKKINVYSWGRERERQRVSGVSGGGAEREGDTES